MNTEPREGDDMTVKTDREPDSGSPTRRGRLLAGLLLLPLALAGCDGLLDVEIPGSVVAADLESPALARAQVVAALGEFECSFAQFVTTSGMFTEEFNSATGRRATNIWNSRVLAIEEAVGGCSTSRDADGFGYWAPMQTARRAAEDGYTRISAFSAAEVPNFERKLADLSLYEGLALLFLGEGYCGVTVNSGPLMTRTQAFSAAEALFTRAMGHAQSAGNQNLVLAATGARAKARLNQGNLQGAASDAQAIPADFTFMNNFTTAAIRRENRWEHLTTTSLRRITVGDDYLNLTVDGVPDTRVPVSDPGILGEDAVTPWYQQLKYTARNQSIPIVSAYEAQLIIAEANAGTAAAVTAINNVRSHFNLPAYTGTGSMEDVIEERRRTFFMEGHRLNDMIRHNIPFPTGVSNKGDTYGDFDCIPIPTNERQNNPNLT